MQLVPLFIVIAAILVAFVGGIIVASSDKRCPGCGARALRCVQFIRATRVVDGERTPDFFSFHECGRCQARFKQERRDRPAAADPEEWRHYVSSVAR